MRPNPFPRTNGWTEGLKLPTWIRLFFSWL